MLNRIAMAHHTVSRIDPSGPTSFNPIPLEPTSNADARSPLNDDNAVTGRFSRHRPRSSAPELVNPRPEQIVKQARLATTATGAAIVLASAGERICLAKTGATAGDVVGYLNAHSAILHACLRTGEAQRCDDAEADSRFDAAVCRRLGLRSILIVPVQSKNTVRGVIEIFSPRPHDFCDRDVLTLQGLAHRVAGVNVDLPKTVQTPTVATDNSPMPVRLPQVAPRSSAPKPRLGLKVRIPAAPPIHWTLLLTLIALPLLMGWMLGAAGAVPAQAPTHARPAIMVPPDTSVTISRVPLPSIPSSMSTPARDSSSAEKAKENPDTAPNASDASALPVFIFEDVANTYLLRRVEPDYPSEAREQRIQGTVVMKVIVGKDGSVERVSRITGDTKLALTAATAIRQWRFKPLLKNGQPREFESHVTLSFELP